MALSNGLLAAQGLFDGLKTGLLTYRDIKKQQHDDALNEQKMGFEAARSGYEFNPDAARSGEGQIYTPTEATQQSQRAGLLKSQFEQSEYERKAKANTPEERAKSRLAVQGLLNKVKPGLGDTVPENTDVDYGDIIKGVVSGTYGAQGRGSGFDFRDKQFAERTHNQLMARLDRDPTLKAQFGQLRGMDNAAQLVTNAAREGKPITTQQFQDFQQSVLANLGQKGVQAVGERNAKYFDSLGLRGTAMIQLLTGQPQDIGKDNPLYQHVHDLARWETENVRSQIQDQIDGLTAGAGYIYDENPKLKRDLDRKIQALMKKTNTRNYQPESAPPQGLIPQGGAAPQGAQLKPEDQQAIQWAKSNPNDPRSKKILSLHGM